MHWIRQVEEISKMVQQAKRKKFHDKDKYYNLAKEQGFRSRAAFKLTQINRKFHFLENASVVIDLCAAPGGWTQVASRTMNSKRGSSSTTGTNSNNSGSIILAVDILPMRAIPNVITLIGDITTEKTKAQIKAQLQTAQADVVLCDGAPNVGASYDRDAYQQNEIALHALKCATQHLKQNGTFVTKIYRSADYSAYLWVVKQFFQRVQAVKPNASRSQSAEIFLVCTGYLAPTSIDPRMLDPKHVFEQVDGAASGGGDHAQGGGNGTTGVTIFHKQYDAKRRSRQGYDLTHLDASMRNIGSIADFIESSVTPISTSSNHKKNQKDPIQILSVCTGLSFSCHLCKEKDRNTDTSTTLPECNCQFYLNHPLTTFEIKSCLSDLKVLNKGDFKGLLIWRTKMQDAIKQRDEPLSDDDDDSDDDDNGSDDNENEYNSEAEEDGVQAEIEQLRLKHLRKVKRLKKKERELMAKRRRRAALGMDLNAIDVPDNDKIFSLATITNKGDLEAAREVDLNKVTDDQLLVSDDYDSEEERDGLDIAVQHDSEGNVVAQGDEDELDEDTGYNYRLDRELDAAYDRYLSKTKNGQAKAGTKMAKRSKKETRLKSMEQVHEDQEMMMGDDTKTYVKMLQGPKESDDDSSDDNNIEGESSDDDDGFYDEPVTPEEHVKGRKSSNIAKLSTSSEEKNPLIHTLPEDPASLKSARWFSNPLFEKITTTASLATLATPHMNTTNRNIDDYLSDSDDNVDNLEESDEEMKQPTKKSRKEAVARKKKSTDDDEDKEKAITGEEVMASMPKTDKQIRHEKRLKAMERKERKLAKRARLAGEPVDGFEVVEGANDDDDDDADVEHLNDQQKKKLLEARALIKAGLGSNPKGVKESEGFEIVSSTAQSTLPIMDKRTYDSENEDYDSDDYAKTLALGTMMLRQSKAKALVDASYNRFAWNDPEDLPDWFVDDENKNYRPQLPIPPELMEKMKARFLSLSTRPIAKVAEARARKNKRAKAKLTAAKKKAEAVANTSEMSETMKLKAISKAMRGQDSSKQGKTYVVSKKGVKTNGGKGVKLVDKRMKSDKRSMDRALKKKKGGIKRKR